MSAPTSHVLVVAATAAEAAHVPARLPLLVTGVGKVAAASSVAAALAQSPPGRLPLVVNIGTAGSLSPDVTGLHVPSTVWNHDLDAEALAAVGLQVDTVLQIPDGDGTALATGDVFVTDPAVARRLARRASLVDMEGFAVAWACARAGARCRLVKHVSDSADESAWQWASAVDASARALGRWLEDVEDAPEQH